MKKLEKKQMNAVKGGDWLDDIAKIGPIKIIPDVIK